MPTVYRKPYSPTPSHWGVVFFLVLKSLISSTASAEDAPDQVLVYYANETAPDGQEAANYDTIIGWLRSGENDKHAQIAGQLERDRHIFPAAVDVETNVLLSEMPGLENGPQAVIFTNRLVRQGKCLMWRHGWTEHRETDFPAPQDENYILAANPLSRPETMRDVLVFVADQFSPDKHEFIFVTKSHGSGEKAIPAWLVVRAEVTSREELLRLASDATGVDELPEWAGSLGISKEEFFMILDESEMQFSLVYWEACEALSGEFRPTHVPDNVNHLLLIAANAHYINVLYGDILANVEDGERLSDAMLHNLPSKFVLVGEGLPRSRRWPLWIYFIPLAFFIAWAAWQWGLRGGKKPR